ncbi:MAG: MotA/TolQ/ExbB proton channel family protein [Thermoanaerobaculia bacterium]|nr:MotA/TolQ/ExbB proton channel family protein [Thermoanaerobaculia bacterium]
MEGMGSFTLGELWASMGFIARAVVFTLAAMSIYSLYVIVDRILVYRKARNESLALAKEVTNLLKADRPKDAITAARKYKNSPLAQLVAAGLMEFEQEAGSKLPFEEVVEASRRAIERAALISTGDLRRGISSLATIATTAPFVGLFGTVVGIINAFQAISAAGGGGNLGSVSKGISEALITTAFGIFVALPAAWAFNNFTARMERFQVEMTNSSSEMVDFFIKKQTGK